MSNNEQAQNNEEIRKFNGSTADDQLVDGVQNDQGQTLRERLAN
ncbi:hypothetical protein [Thalassobius sp. Cn5-15]|jgi:hypothetical protein|nr:hypothetical protein [Thalassobius sp. Cn5-15]